MEWTLDRINFLIDRLRKVENKNTQTIPWRKDFTTWKLSCRRATFLSPRLKREWVQNIKGYYEGNKFYNFNNKCGQNTYKQNDEENTSFLGKAISGAGKAVAGVPKLAGIDNLVVSGAQSSAAGSTDFASWAGRRNGEAVDQGSANGQR